MSFFDDQTPVGRMNPVSVTGSKIGTPASVTGLSVAHRQIGPLIETTLTLTNVEQTVVDGVEYQGTLLYTLPKGKISWIGVNGTLQQKTTSTLATSLNASSTGAVGVGTATASSTTLSTTMQDLLPTTAFVSSATVNVAGTAVIPTPLDNVTADAIDVLDGTSAAKKIYLNSAYATTTDVDGNATQTWTGTIEITWMFWSGTVSAVD
jgi:hypothetical protein